EFDDDDEIVDESEKEPGTWSARLDVPAVNGDELAKLARLYLVKVPGFTPDEVDAKFLRKNGDTWEGISEKRLELGRVPKDADERALQGPLTMDNLKWYVGKKAIGRLGCYGCHDVPGFDTTKPIGTPLNDWGKKDPERLAFEDAEGFVREHFNIV